MPYKPKVGDIVAVKDKISMNYGASFSQSNKNLGGYHYLVVDSVRSGSVDGRLMTSLESRGGSLKNWKFAFVRAGYIIPVPRACCGLPLFSGIFQRNVSSVPLTDVRFSGKCVDPDYLKIKMAR